MKYMLDTNIISAIERNPNGPLYHKLLGRGIDNFVTSIIVVGEVEFGISKGISIEAETNLRDFLDSVQVLPVEHPVEQEYGRIRAELQRKGTPIGQNDLWIAAHALALGLTLVTDNVSEFERVDGLRVENWLRA